MTTGFGVIGVVKEGTNLGGWVTLASMLTFFMSVRRLWTVVLVLDRVQYFDKYKATVRARWPDLIADD